ncbi:glutamine-hydrolyzing carbamoyl-phosphate synthase small subunit [Elusimicrobiota bacterium]
MKEATRAILLLQDGSQFEGKSFGYNGKKTGEVVFNTSLTGYEEIITDPSYCGQIVIMCYPHIGNYGINLTDAESYGVWIEGLIVKEYSKIYSNYRARISLASYLKRKKIVAIEGIDTRALVKKIRQCGSMKGVIAAGHYSIRDLEAMIRKMPSICDTDLVARVNDSPFAVFKKYKGRQVKKRSTVAIIDCGTKLNIIRSLEEEGFNIRLFRADTKLQNILDSGDISGVVLSNGPGDPRKAAGAIKLARELIKYNERNYLPVMGICLGHQIIGLASGAKTYKLKFGHHGGNHPVKDLRSGKIEITAQNHNFCVKYDSVKKDYEVTHINLNDDTVEGLQHRSLPVASYQYHPESCPGPHDSRYIFSDFKELLHGKKKRY